MEMGCGHWLPCCHVVQHRQTDRKKETLARHGDAVVLLVQVDSAAKKVVSLVSSFGRIGSVALPACVVSVECCVVAVQLNLRLHCRTWLQPVRSS
jgi:hypothetical protein